jgi:hypothetical protein
MDAEGIGIGGGTDNKTYQQWKVKLAEEDGCGPCSQAEAELVLRNTARLTETQLQSVMRQALDKYCKARVEPGEVSDMRTMAVRRRAHTMCKTQQCAPCSGHLFDKCRDELCFLRTRSLDEIDATLLHWLHGRRLWEPLALRASASRVPRYLRCTITL